ncbi:hypothetical protein O7599_17105 [Streptomyces sp. WMMC500]|uniref:hypothetical protein n=1 Tax=Streptomyces sp. WMMC500 TaxID=3015154 RepID=UPI00248C5212|nr:hypothetical protein [Streptomyces sp. WMMC500]WBB64127.1 hypothetical protein O7599_17105 [Streptomyces sp. WMMC500]
MNRTFHFWRDVVEYLGPVTCKTSDTLREEAPYVWENGWVTDRNAMNHEYLRYVSRRRSTA